MAISSQNIIDIFRYHENPLMETRPLTKLHRKIERNENVCRAQELGFYAQGHSQVRGQIVPELVLLINYCSKFDKTSQKDKA